MSSVFSVLHDFSDAQVLDAFAGSGALGIEALSRGAKRCVFCERDAAVMRILRSNIESLSLDSHRYHVRKMDTLTQAALLKDESFDLVFLDPPYHTDPVVIQKLLEELASFACLRQHAIISYEHAKAVDDRVDEALIGQQWQVRNIKHFGDISIHIVEYLQKEVDTQSIEQEKEWHIMRRALTPGTFDPITAGHLDVITRASQFVDELIVGVAASPKKGPLFSLEDRVALAKEATSHLPNVRVEPFDNLLVNFVKELEATIIIKGLRAITDFEYEFQMTALNYQLDQEIETIFIMSPPQYMYLSSSIVREIASLHGDVDGFVPDCVKSALLRKFPKE